MERLKEYWAFVNSQRQFSQSISFYIKFLEKSEELGVTQTKYTAAWNTDDCD